MKHDKRLFDFIHSYGHGYFNDQMCIHSIKGPKALKDSHYYRVFLIGGICFEIWKDVEDERPYFFDAHWKGSFNISTSTDVLAILLILGHDTKS